MSCSTTSSMCSPSTSHPGGQAGIEGVGPVPLISGVVEIPVADAPCAAPPGSLITQLAEAFRPWHPGVGRTYRAGHMVPSMAAHRRLDNPHRSWRSGVCWRGQFIRSHVPPVRWHKA
jgi:hypothetical protein